MTRNHNFEMVVDEVRKGYVFGRDEDGVQRAFVRCSLDVAVGDRVTCYDRGYGDVYVCFK